MKKPVSQGVPRYAAPCLTELSLLPTDLFLLEDSLKDSGNESFVEDENIYTW